MIGIVDYGVGNIGSVLRAFERLGIPAEMFSDAEKISHAERLVLPGVGHAAQGMKNLLERGLREPVVAAAHSGVPVLGICLGMQLLTKRSAEGDTECLGLLDAETTALEAIAVERGEKERIPHMGWNSVEDRADHPIFTDIEPDAEFYFAHSYAVKRNLSLGLGTTPYLGGFASVFGEGRIVGVQFHPEKSRDAGLQILKNFSQW